MVCENALEQVCIWVVLYCNYCSEVFDECTIRDQQSTCYVHVHPHTLMIRSNSCTYQVNFERKIKWSVDRNTQTQLLHCKYTWLYLIKQHVSAVRSPSGISHKSEVTWNSGLSYNYRCAAICNSLTFWHRSFTFNSNKSPAWCNNFSVYYPDVCLQLNTFRAFSRPSSGAQWLQWQPLFLPSYRGESRAVFVVGPAGQPDREHSIGLRILEFF